MLPGTTYLVLPAPHLQPGSPSRRPAGLGAPSRGRSGALLAPRFLMGGGQVGTSGGPFLHSSIFLYPNKRPCFLQTSQDCPTSSPCWALPCLGRGALGTVCEGVDPSLGERLGAWPGPPLPTVCAQGPQPQSVTTQLCTCRGLSFSWGSCCCCPGNFPSENIGWGGQTGWGRPGDACEWSQVSPGGGEGALPPCPSCSLLSSHPQA